MGSGPSKRKRDLKEEVLGGAVEGADTLDGRGEGGSEGEEGLAQAVRPHAATAAATADARAAAAAAARDQSAASCPPATDAPYATVAATTAANTNSAAATGAATGPGTIATGIESNGRGVVEDSGSDNRYSSSSGDSRDDGASDSGHYGDKVSNVENSGSRDVVSVKSKRNNERNYERTSEKASDRGSDRRGRATEKADLKGDASNPSHASYPLSKRSRRSVTAQTIVEELERADANSASKGGSNGATDRLDADEGVMEVIVDGVVGVAAGCDGGNSGSSSSSSSGSSSGNGSSSSGRGSSSGDGSVHVVAALGVDDTTEGVLGVDVTTEGSASHNCLTPSLDPSLTPSQSSLGVSSQSSNVSGDSVDLGSGDEERRGGPGNGEDGKGGERGGEERRENKWQEVIDGKKFGKIVVGRNGHKEPTAIVEKEKERKKEGDKEREKEKEAERVRTKHVTQAMMRMWRAECQRVIGFGVGVGGMGYETGVCAGVDVGVGGGGVGGGALHVEGNRDGVEQGLGRLLSQGAVGETDGREAIGGGYRVLGRSIKGWELFVTEGPATFNSGTRTEEERELEAGRVPGTRGKPSSLTGESRHI